MNSAVLKNYEKRGRFELHFSTKRSRFDTFLEVLTIQGARSVPFLLTVSPLSVKTVKTGVSRLVERGLPSALNLTFSTKLLFSPLFSGQNGLFSPPFLHLSDGFDRLNGPEQGFLNGTKRDVSAHFCSFSPFSVISAWF